jgi:hypothetical protein
MAARGTGVVADVRRIEDQNFDIVAERALALDRCWEADKTIGACREKRQRKRSHEYVYPLAPPLQRRRQIATRGPPG